MCILASGRRPVGRRAFPAVTWLTVCVAWLALAIFHPESNSLISGTAQFMLVVSILSPAFWVPVETITTRRLARLIGLLFVCNALSALVGIGQFYRPDTFSPPDVHLFQVDERMKLDLSYTTADGRMVVRPMGLSDTPGGAAGAGVLTGLVGMAWALRRIAVWKRLVCLGLALVGMTIIYLCQVRAQLLTLLASLIGLLILFVLQGNFRQAALLAIGGGSVFAGSLVWVIRAGGDVVLERFLTLVAEDPGKVYYENRGAFLEETYTRHIWDYPLGAGLGRWGQMYHYFGDRSFPYGTSRGPIWVEVQWTAWVIDGGFPLLIGYVGAIAAAVLNSIRIARTSPDRDLRFWGAVICALSVNVLVGTFGYCPFISPIGLQFWALVAALHAADQRASVRSVRSV
jgi:hypothetical protein